MFLQSNHLELSCIVGMQETSGNVFFKNGHKCIINERTLINDNFICLIFKMAGLYLHIPFCKKACSYCDFHFSTSLKLKEEVLASIRKELMLQKDYLSVNSLKTIYFGGGTPSLLSRVELEQFFELIFKNYSVEANVEITLEANPDDITSQKTKELKSLPINRLSIGVQSFSQVDLEFMNRAHTSEQALQCLKIAQDGGFDNLTVDLIYGSPTTSMQNWVSNLETIKLFGIPHFSCYCLTIEEKTALSHWIKKGKVKPLNEEQAFKQYEVLMDFGLAAGYEHYEISNFAKSGWYSVHNSGYWAGHHYLGVGPSAHSYNGNSRQWNVANNAHYIKSLQEDKVPYQREELSKEQRYNEFVMTCLRTMWGCNLEVLSAFAPDACIAEFKKNITPHLNAGLVEHIGSTYILARKGKFFADKVISDLMVV